MKRATTIIVVAVVFFGLGAMSVVLFRKRPSNPWITVTSDKNSFGLTDAALNIDIPWPKTTPPSGKAKFLNRDKGEQIGYVLKLPIGPNPTSVLPEKYRRKTKMANGFEVGPPDQVTYEGHFAFILKDADGFTLMKVDGPKEELWANSENQMQNVTEETVPDSVVRRAKSVYIEFTVTSCNPCTGDIFDAISTKPNPAQ
jgi:hypothetical protein